MGKIIRSETRRKYQQNVNKKPIIFYNIKMDLLDQTEHGYSKCGN